MALPKPVERSPGSGRYGGMTRIGSGRLVLSTRMTSAPRHPHIKVACAPNPSRVKSRIRTPAQCHRSRLIRPCGRYGCFGLGHGGDDSVIPETRAVTAVEADRR